MWYLVCPNKDGRSYRLTQDKDEHQVSRLVGDIVLNGDQSVSRKHAVFQFETDKNGKTVVAIKDLASKYGTYINGSLKLEPNKPYQLADGDMITFGCQWNEWSFHSKSLVITTSTMSIEAKTKLRRTISELGGTVVGDWQESCTHLTMVEILLTAKVVCALASGIPIIVPDYWENFKKAIEEETLPPNYELFIPPLKESILNKNKVSFAVNEKRKHVFSGKTFIFSSEKQMKKYKTIVLTAGGSYQTMVDCEMTMDELCGPNVIVMQHSSDTQTPAYYSTVLREMRYKGLKPIPESEIGLAVLMCSLDMYCNMRYNVVGNVLEGGIVMSQVKRSEILADDSQMSVIEPVVVKTENSAVKTERLEVDMVDTNRGPPSMESSSLSSGGTCSTSPLQLNEEDTLPCDLAEALPRNRISLEENTSPIIAPDSSRKRPASIDLVEPLAKKCPPEGKAPELRKKQSHFLDDFTLGNCLQTNPGPSRSNNSGENINEKRNTTSSMTSKRKLGVVDDIVESSRPVKKPGTLGLLPNFCQEPSTSTGKISSMLQFEDDDQWIKDGEKAIKEMQASDWGDILKGLDSKLGNGLEGFGFGMKVKFANLVVDVSAKKKETETPVYDPSSINYKKFRKVKSVGCEATLPVIIGGSDLVPYRGGDVDF